MRKIRFNWPIVADLLLWVLFALAVLCSCSRKVYVPVETVRVDTFVKRAVRVDSVRLTDSVYVSERVAGDTVYIVKTRTQWRDRVSVRVDTVYKSRVDTVTQVVEVVKPAKRSRGWLMWAGIGVAVLVLAGIVGGVRRG